MRPTLIARTTPPRLSRSVCVGVLAVAAWLPDLSVTCGDEVPLVLSVDRQPLVSASQRLVEGMAFNGTPLPPDVITALQAAWKTESDRVCVRQIQQALDPLCLVDVHINAESRVKVAAGPIDPLLTQQGWTTFLVKVRNDAGVNPQLVVESPNAAPVYQQGRGARQQPATDERLVTPGEVGNRWMDISLLDREPLRSRLTGLEVEYRAVTIFSRDQGRREASLAFHIGQGTQDIGFRNAVPILFRCQPAVDVTLGVRDTDGQPTTAAFIVRDSRGRVYPNPSRRLAPDFFFHHQVYRHDGESLTLPPGEYTIQVSRGPEYRPIKRQVTIPAVAQHQLDFQLERWIHIAKRHWYSGDHHVHAAGCAHYDSPTEGVGPEDMMRHILGEDLNVGCVLSWGPCWYTQKEFFEGEVHRLSTSRYLMRYDVEVSGFPSSHAGHLCLLNLQEDDYPGTTRIEQWPTWTVPVLQWGQSQNGVVGYSHSGWGLALPDIMPDGSRRFVNRPWGGAPRNWPGKAADTLPDYAMPPFDGIGANEYIVSAALGACDFISTVDTPAIWELNIWYHTLNCGLTSRISGETDFPCIYGDRVGLGRVYVQLPEDEELSYENWIAGLKDGRSYVGDGLSHILDFAVDGLGVGETAPGEDTASKLQLAEPGTVQVTFDAAALLEARPTPQTEAIRTRRLDEKPYWHIERCRLGDSRNVPVEVIVNGEVVATQTLAADGTVRPFELSISLEESAWIAVRILPSVHTNPVFVYVDDQPIRASQQSAQWCQQAVETCWKSKQPMIQPSEREAARKAYDQAAQYYSEVAAEAQN